MDEMKTLTINGTQFEVVDEKARRIDDTLTQSGQAADAAVVGQKFDELSEEIKNIPDGKDGGYYSPSVDADGNLSWTASKSDMPAVDGANIKGHAGVTPNIQIGSVETLKAGSAATATITGTAENPLLNLGIPMGATGASGGGNTEPVLSENLFDKTTAVTGQIFYHSSSGPSLISNNNGFYAYVPLRGAGIYRTKVFLTEHGSSYANRVPVLKSDNTFLKNVTGTVTENGDGNAADLEFTITADMISNGAAVYAFDGYAPYLDSLMIVKDTEYPSTYIPYGYIEVAAEDTSLRNILYGKTAVFLGDSICAGTTVGDDLPEYGYGWAGLIGESNNMVWGNYGRNGGTITPIEAVAAESRDLSSQLDIVLAAHTTADYIIFEGGVNDADQMGADGLGEISGDYETFDTTTFTGAMESLVFNILAKYPDAKVGYIVAQKMGNAPYTSASSIRRQYFDRAVDVCKKWGIPYIDLWNGSPLNPMLSIHYDRNADAAGNIAAGKLYVDGQHLTLKGYQMIMPKIEAFMRTI